MQYTIVQHQYKCNSEQYTMTVSSEYITSIQCTTNNNIHATVLQCWGSHNA